MLVLINNQDNKYSKEWCLLEFQGDIIGDLIGNILGEIEIKEETKAEMTIGQHFLEGSIVILKQPFLVIEKTKTITTENEEFDTSESKIIQHEDNENNIEIIGIAKRKIIFKTRPKPIGLKK